MLNDQKIRPKSNVKRLHPKPHPERDRQFEYLNRQRAAFARAGWPCISVDSKKKELVGNFFNRGRQWCREAIAVNTHDFSSYATGQAVPYGLYDVTRNLGYVALGQSADTSELAVDALVWWWSRFGRNFYPTAPELLVLADAGGSNGCRSRLWKQQLQVKLADAFGLAVTVCHYPTGASKWNPIEHRLFSQVSRTWAATPLSSMDVVLDGLRSTTASTGLRVEATLFDAVYQKGLTVTDEEMASLASQGSKSMLSVHSGTTPFVPGNREVISRRSLSERGRVAERNVHVALGACFEVLSAKEVGGFCNGDLPLPNGLEIAEEDTFSEDYGELVIRRGESVSLKHNFRLSASQPLEVIINPLLRIRHEGNEQSSLEWGVGEERAFVEFE